MSRTKTIQVDLDLFKAMMNYIDRHPDLSDPDHRQILDGIQIKLRSMLRHRLYTIYKTSSSGEARSLAREAYLNELGVPASFRWSDHQDSNITRCVFGPD